MEIVNIAKETMPELSFYTVDRFVLQGTRDDGPPDCEMWEFPWNPALWAECVELAEDCRAPPMWSAILVARKVKNAHRD